MTEPAEGSLCMRVSLLTGIHSTTLVTNKGSKQPRLQRTVENKILVDSRCKRSRCVKVSH